MKRHKSKKRLAFIVDVAKTLEKNGVRVAYVQFFEEGDFSTPYTKGKIYLGIPFITPPGGKPYMSTGGKIELERRCLEGGEMKGWYELNLPSPDQKDKIQKKIQKILEESGYKERVLP